MSGFGFGTSPTGISVTVGGVGCAIQSVEPRIIKCTTGASSAGQVDVAVSAKDCTFLCSYTLNNGYTYDNLVQPVITGINPTEGPTYGGVILTITGSSFPEVSEEVTVSMGTKRCEVQTSSSTEVTCVVPNNPPGDVSVVVDTQTKGESLQGEGICSSLKYLRAFR